ncbi:hypothetical protein LG291_23055 [Cytobacillus firmus]|uniref:hypothetical protein n=1 Tax=Cytobacillus firmus TaxID=1399 RepID=UPI00384E9A00
MKKWHAVLLMSGFFAAAGAFYYEGAPEEAAAVQEETKVVNEQQDNDSADEIIPEGKEETSTAGKNEEKPEEIKNGQNNPEVGKPKPNAETEAVQEYEMIDINGEMYELIMDEKKYSNIVHLIKDAKEYNSKLYAIPNSDVFAVLKEGKVISSFSVGSMSVLPQHAEFAKIKLSGYKGINHNIDLVNETHGKVTVEWGESAFYSIEYRNGWIVIHYN